MGEEFIDYMTSQRSPFSPPANVLGESKSGHLVLYAEIGRFDAPTFISSRTLCHPLNKDVRLLFQFLEYMMWRVDCISRQRKMMAQVIKLINFAGLGNHRLPILVPELRHLVSTYAPLAMKYYCEHDILYVMFNTPFIFRVLWTFVSAIMSRRQRLRVFVGKTAECKVVVHEHILPNILPESLGGANANIRFVTDYPSNPKDIKDFLERTAEPKFERKQQEQHHHNQVNDEVEGLENIEKESQLVAFPTPALVDNPTEIVGLDPKTSMGVSEAHTSASVSAVSELAPPPVLDDPPVADDPRKSGCCSLW